MHQHACGWQQQHTPHLSPGRINDTSARLCNANAKAKDWQAQRNINVAACCYHAVAAPRPNWHQPLLGLLRAHATLLDAIATLYASKLSLETVYSYFTGLACRAWTHPTRTSICSKPVRSTSIAHTTYVSACEIFMQDTLCIDLPRMCLSIKTAGGLPTTFADYG